MAEPESQHDKRSSSGTNASRISGITERPRAPGGDDGDRTSAVTESNREPARISTMTESSRKTTLIPPSSSYPNTFRTGEPPLPTQPDNEIPIPASLAPDTLPPTEPPFELELDTLPPVMEEDRDTIPSPPPPAPDPDKS
ncbi:MAG: hypothetical protein H6717_40225 [Polyangiaceae bacterium]|nr:hypothetical protein [Polyangiaceae bacterium]